jgi:hypothetical protein
VLARPETMRCVECGLPYGSPDFHLHYGKPENGPAYWSDRGLLCSPNCSLAHHRRRREEGTLPSKPADDPFGDPFDRGR